MKESEATNENSFKLLDLGHNFQKHFRSIQGYTK